MMTRMILGALGAMFVTAGVGGVTVYHVRSSKSDPTATSASATAEPAAHEETSSGRARGLGIVAEKNGARRSVKVGSDIEAETDGTRQSAKVGAIHAEQNGKKSSVKVGPGVSVQQEGEDGSVQIGGTQVKQNGKHVSIGGVSVYAP